MSGFLSSWHRDLWLSLEMPQGCHTCHSVLSRSSGWQSCQCIRIRCKWSGLGIGVFLNCSMIPGVPLKFQHEIAPSFEVRWECLDSFPNQAGKWTLTRVLPQLHPGYPKLERWGERAIYIEMRKEFSIKRIEERREADMPWFTQKANKIPSQGTYTIHVGHQCPFE